MRSLDRRRYLIYAIERVRGGYLNNAIRILPRHSINAFQPSAVFVPEKRETRRRRGDDGGRLTRVDIWTISRLGEGLAH